jgi:hypothetical protein
MGCFFDLHHSAFFNSLPVARDGLLDDPFSRPRTGFGETG